jgi:hypothetical protein
VLVLCSGPGPGRRAGRESPCPKEHTQQKTKTKKLATGNDPALGSHRYQVPDTRTWNNRRMPTGSDQGCPHSGPTATGSAAARVLLSSALLVALAKLALAVQKASTGTASGSSDESDDDSTRNDSQFPTATPQQMVLLQTASNATGLGPASPWRANAAKRMTQTISQRQAFLCQVAVAVVAVSVSQLQVLCGAYYKVVALVHCCALYSKAGLNEVLKNTSS